jgi:hypothetical protein
LLSFTSLKKTWSVTAGSQNYQSLCQVGSSIALIIKSDENYSVCQLRLFKSDELYLSEKDAARQKERFSGLKRSFPALFFI